MLLSLSTGGLDILVNNAGIMDSMGANDEVSTAEWGRVIRVNLTAPGGTKTNISVIPVAGNKGPEIFGGSVDGGWSAV